MKTPIRLLISDLDGTLVDTFEANYLAYKEAFSCQGLSLQQDDYRACFGLRYDDFMEQMCVTNPMCKQAIREMKARLYPRYFSCLQVNRPLLDFITAFHHGGGKTALASTARRTNLDNILTYIGSADVFDIVLAGEDVSQGKPNPEIYLKALQLSNCSCEETIIFEDSKVGLQAAQAAGISMIMITPEFYGY